MKKTPLLLLLIIFALSCQNNSNLNVTDCLCQSFEDNGEELLELINSYEQYLIHENILSGKTGKDYMNFFDSQKGDKAHFVEVNNSFTDKFTQITLPDSAYLNQCFRTKLSDFQDQKYKKLQNKIDSLFNAKHTTLANTTDAMLSVLTEKDFEQDYYKFITFIIIDHFYSPRTIGILRELPPLLETQKSKNPLVIISIGENKVMADSIEISQNKLKLKINKYLKANKSKSSIIFQNRANTSYNFYLTIQELIQEELLNVRNEYSQEKFNKNYTDLDESQQKEIREIIPSCITEAEPQ